MHLFPHQNPLYPVAAGNCILGFPALTSVGKFYPVCGLQRIRAMAMAGLAASSPCVYSPSCFTSPSFKILCCCSSSPSPSSPSATSSSSASSLSFGFPFVGLKRSTIRGVQRHEALHPTLESFGSCGARTGRRRTRRGVGVVMPIRAGLPVVSSIPIVGPLANFALNPVLLFVLYAAGGRHPSTHCFLW